MIRILYVIEEKGTTVFGGAARDLIWILKGLDRSRFLPSVLLSGDDSFLRLLKQEMIDGVDIYRLPLPPWRKFKHRLTAPLAIRKLDRLIREGRFDIVHVNSGYNDVPYVTRAARRAGAVSVFTIRSGDIIEKKVRQYGYGMSDCVIVCADDHRRLLAAHGIESRTIYSGVEEQSSLAPITRASVGIPEHVPVIGTVANLVPMKGYPVLLEAMAIVVKHLPDVRLVAVGGGNEGYQHELKALADRLGVADRVLFVGYQPCGRQWIPLFDLFVLASICCEAATIAVLEAMAEGKAVVASAIGGIPELVVDGTTGRLVPPEKPEVLARAIVDLMEQFEVRDRMGRAGKEHVARAFSIEAELARLQTLYEELVGRARSEGHG